MTREEAIEKARKLMALGQSDNENEAALAMARAQSILERFEIEAADLAVAIEAEPMVEGAWNTGQRKAVMWQVSLTQCLARANGCDMFKNGARVVVCGRQADVRRTRNMFSWIVPEINRLAARQGRGRGAAFTNAFRHGAVSAIHAEIKRERDALREEMRGTVSDTALVVMDTKRDEATAFMNKNHRLTKSPGGQISDSGGFAAGRNAGEGLYGRAGRGALNGERKQIGG